MTAVIGEIGEIGRGPEFPAEYLDALAHADDAAGDRAGDRANGVAETPTGRRTRGMLRVREDVEIENLPPLQWLAEPVIPQSSVAVLYGAPGAGKSFVAVSLAFSVVTGAPWLGKPVAAGGTLYCAAEGLAGLGQRVRAWKEAHGFGGQTTGVGFVTGAINLLEPGAARRVVDAAKTREARAPDPVRLIVVDTLAQSMIGDENDTKDMSRLVQVAGAIRDETGATVLFVHHTRKDSDVERGSSTLRGGADTLILCQESDDGRELVCQKQKDAEAFAPIPFKLVAGFGSCVAAFTGDDSLTGPAGPGDGLTPQRLKGLRALADGFTARGATATEWLKSADLPERTFYRVRTYLCDRGYVDETRSRYTITATGRAAARRISVLPTAIGTANPTANSLGKSLKSFSRVAVAEPNGTPNGSSDGSTGAVAQDAEYADFLAQIDERLGQMEEQ